MGAEKSKVKEVGGHELSDEELSFLVKNTDHSVQGVKVRFYNKILEAFLGISEEVDKSQFIQMYRTLFPNGNAEKFSQNMFRIFDTDNSGTIDFREFMLALHLTTNATAEEKLTLSFRMYDLDGNGLIDVLEMKQ